MTKSEFKPHWPPTWNGHPIPYGASVEELTNLLQGPAPACWTAFIALASTPGEAALALLHDYAGSTDPHYRYGAIEAAARHLLSELHDQILLRSVRKEGLD